MLTDDSGFKFFNAEKVSSLMLDFQRTGDHRLFEGILKESTRLIKANIEEKRTTYYVASDELISRINLKLFKSVSHYDPGRGSAYSFVNKVIKTQLCSAVMERKAQLRKQVDWDSSYEQSVPAALRDGALMEDLIWKIRQIKTICTDDFELGAQRWMVDSYIECGFKLRRHEAADAMMTVFNIGHGRARRLHDLTLLEIRRAVWEDHPNGKEIAPASLAGTSSRPLIPYARYLSVADFTNLVCLLEGLAPALVMYIKAQNIRAIRKGSAKALAENLRLIINGHPQARLLFKLEGKAYIEHLLAKSSQ
jgi:hypothetical protein